jgi:hypothetical protein
MINLLVSAVTIMLVRTMLKLVFCLQVKIERILSLYGFPSPQRAC